MNFCPTAAERRRSCFKRVYQPFLIMKNACMNLNLLLPIFAQNQTFLAFLVPKTLTQRLQTFNRTTIFESSGSNLTKGSKHYSRCALSDLDREATYKRSTHQTRASFISRRTITYKYKRRFVGLSYLDRPGLTVMQAETR